MRCKLKPAPKRGDSKQEVKFAYWPVRIGDTLVWWEEYLCYSVYDNYGSIFDHYYWRVYKRRLFTDYVYIKGRTYKEMCTVTNNIKNDIGYCALALTWRGIENAKLNTAEGYNLLLGSNFDNIEVIGDTQILRGGDGFKVLARSFADNKDLAYFISNSCAIGFGDSTFENCDIEACVYL